MLDEIVARLLAEIEGALSFFQAIRDESPLLYKTTEMSSVDSAISQLRLIRPLFPECDVPKEVNLEHAYSSLWSLWTMFHILSDDVDDRVVEAVDSALYSIAESYTKLLSETVFQAVKDHLEDTGETLEGKPNLQAYLNYWQSRLEKTVEAES